jgi:hypothetical protein
MSSHVIVWDIETIPDLRGFAAANGHDGKSDLEDSGGDGGQVSEAHLPFYNLHWRSILSRQAISSSYMSLVLALPERKERQPAIMGGTAER